MTTTTPEPGTVERLRAWAKGSHPLSAAVELLARAFDGRFAAAAQPWIRVEPNGWTWLDDQFLASSLGGLSGGERRVLTIVAALADTTGTRRIDLTDAVTGLDRQNLDLVLAALAHAGGFAEHARPVPGGNRAGARLEPLAAWHAWPVVDSGSQPSGRSPATETTRSAPVQR